MQVSLKHKNLCNTPTIELELSIEQVKLLVNGYIYQNISLIKNIKRAIKDAEWFANEEIIMSLTPKKRILAEPPKEGQNPYYIAIYVADEEARNAVNLLSNEPWARGDRICLHDDKNLIKKDRLHGYVVMNPCFDMEQVIREIENACA